MRRKKQPTADMLRQQLALAADEIIRLRTALAAVPAYEYEWASHDAPFRWLHELPRAPWWRRALGWFA